MCFVFFSSRRRHTRFSRDWSSDVCSSDLVPFFQSQASLEKIQIRALANILNVFAVMFIVLLVLSYVVSEWLTFPLHFITRSLSRTSLTKTNQPLTWDARDEIGLMVREYNNMVYKLEES